MAQVAVSQAPVQNVAPNVATDELSQLQQANEQLNNAVVQLKQQLQLAQMGLQVVTEFSEGQHQLINFLSTFVLGETALREFSQGQDQLIEFLADLLSDPSYLLYWAFEVWHQSRPTPEFMEFLSEAYLKLSEFHPPAIPRNQEENALARIIQGQQAVSQMMANPLQRQESVPVQVGIQPSPQLQQLAKMQQQEQTYQRPSVPAPPIPSQNSNGNGWNGVHQDMSQGNTLQALRRIGTLSAADWREMFNTSN